MKKHLLPFPRLVPQLLFPTLQGSRVHLEECKLICEHRPKVGKYCQFPMLEQANKKNNKI